nr:putative ribonuclease H-like domain-containing protein [Tanacetum cinerariifolium]
TNRVNAVSAPVTAVGPNLTNSTNRFNTASPSDSAVSPNFEIAGKSSFVDPSKYPDDPDIPELEDIIYSDDEEDVGAEADLSNLETNISFSPIPTTRVHKDHLVTQIIGDLTSAPQTRKPKKVHQALKDPSWIEAMQEELLQFKMKKVWVLVDLPKGKRAIGSKWVFRNKKDKRGSVIRNKARLVTQGHTQEEGIEYDEVFAPVARIKAIQLFLAYASFMGFMVYQMDVKRAFLYETIDEEVYVCQPPGFKDPDYPGKVYKVVKALYGLHQAPRAWYETLANYLMENGFQKGKIDQTLFIKKKKRDILLVHVYVDDIIFGSTNKELCKAFEKLMKDNFQMSSMGELTFFLGLQVKQKDDGIFISQDKYIAEILRKFSFTDVKSASTSIEIEKPLLKDPDGKDVDVYICRSMIGSLMYLTSPNQILCLLFVHVADSKLPQKCPIYMQLKEFLEKPLLKDPDSKDVDVYICRDSFFNLVAYSDSDYAGASLDWKSITGGCKFLSCRLISCNEKNHTVVASSLTEAEYVAAASCCAQVLWIQNQLLDYGKELASPKQMTLVDPPKRTLVSRVQLAPADEVEAKRCGYLVLN